MHKSLATLATELSEPRAPSKRGFVYVCRADNGLVKIGRSSNWKRRLHDLNTALPYTLRVIFIFECALAVETYLHRVFARQRIQGEWFNLPESSVDSIPSHVLDVDVEAGRVMSGTEALQREWLPEWLEKALKAAQSKRILSMFSVVIYLNGAALELDVEAKIRALLTLAKYHKIPKEEVLKALQGVMPGEG